MLHPWRRGTAGGEDPEHRQGAALGAGETQKGVHRKGRAVDDGMKMAELELHHIYGLGGYF